MPYDLWRTEEFKEAARSPQAFVFDGWSHEPLIVDRKQDVQAVSQDSDTAALVSRPGVSKAE